MPTHDHIRHGRRRSKPRHHHMLQSLIPALALLSLKQETSASALTLAWQQVRFPRQHNQSSHSRHRRRHRHSFALHENESLVDFESYDASHCVTSTSTPQPPLSGSSFLPSPFAIHEKRISASQTKRVSGSVASRGPNSRLSLTALFMNQSDAANEGDNNDGSSQKPKPISKGKGESKENAVRAKADKDSIKPASTKEQTIPKGTTVSSNAVESNDTPTAKGENKSKRPRRRSNKANNKYNRQRRQRKEKQSGASSKEKTKSPKVVGESATVTENLVKGNRSNINTSDGNNSLKEFKTKQPSSEANDATSESEMKHTGEIRSDVGLKRRVIQLETLVSNQITEIQKLRREIEELRKSTAEFANVVELLREAGLRLDEDDESAEDHAASEEGGKDALRNRSSLPKEGDAAAPQQQQTAFYDDMEIFGIAPTTVTDAADAAGSSILSAILAGKHRMLVDVRDAELTRDPALFVEFIELAILPVAAGLEGLDRDEYTRNRVKIVFPTVKELMAYRRSMALAAPEVVALSTLGFDPVEERDNLIVVVAPSPDDLAGVTMMQKLLERTDRNYSDPSMRIQQPVVVLNHHMVPIDMGNFGKFTVVYHLRLLSVQYMTGDAMPEYVAKEKISGKLKGGKGDEGNEGSVKGKDFKDKKGEDDSALEAAMTHAREIGVHQGVTRAMVIRAYPKPWHVFVDTSPDTDADFEVAATFDVEPTQEDVNFAIVECLEGSEREDEIVAQQMQAALEAGQLNRVSEMLGIPPTSLAESVGGNTLGVSEDDEGSLDKKNPTEGKDPNDWDDLYYDDWFNEDSV
eukprot:g3526.t1 g3526   contig12:2251281-2253781(-)